MKKASKVFKTTRDANNMLDLKAWIHIHKGNFLAIPLEVSITLYLGFSFLVVSNSNFFNVQKVLTLACLLFAALFGLCFLFIILCSYWLTTRLLQLAKGIPSKSPFKKYVKINCKMRKTLVPMYISGAIIYFLSGITTWVITSLLSGRFDMHTLIVLAIFSMIVAVVWNMGAYLRHSLIDWSLIIPGIKLTNYDMARIRAKKFKSYFRFTLWFCFVILLIIIAACIMITISTKIVANPDTANPENTVNHLQQYYWFISAFFLLLGVYVKVVFSHYLSPNRKKDSDKEKPETPKVYFNIYDFK